MEIRRLVFCGELIRTPDAYDHKGILQSLEWLKNDGIIDDYAIVDPILNYANEVVRQINAVNPDLVVHGNTDSLSSKIIPHVDARQVFFMGDFRPTLEEYQPHWDRWIENSKGLSMLLLSNKSQLGMWQDAFGIPAKFWPHGCFVPDSLEYDPKQEKDLVFIGSHNWSGSLQKRAELIKTIEGMSPVKISHVNGDGTEGRNRVWRDMAKLYHSSKMVLDISHYWDVDSYASGRFWYSAGLGACSITKRFPNCEDFYKDKEHKAYFDTPEEAVELIEHYLSRPKERQAMKLRAYEKNKKDHNYRKRFTDLFKMLDGNE